MITAWTSHIKDPEEKASFEAKIKAAKPVLDRLIDILKQEEKGLSDYERGIKIFDQPNWDYKQAYLNGCLSYIGTMKKLADIDSTN